MTNGTHTHENGAVQVIERPAQASGKTLKQLIESKQADMAKVATRYLSAESLVKIVGVAMSRVPYLADCTPLSVLTSMMTCAQLGLAPNTPTGECYLIPYRNNKLGAYECQLIIGYRGMVTLARRSGDIASLQAEVVREGDTFELEFGLDAKFRHVPVGDETKPIVKAWALAKFKDGSHQLAVMSKSEIDKIKAGSKAGKFGPWVDHYPEMAKKTVIRRLCKLLPLTLDDAMAIGTADKTEFNVDMEIAGQIAAQADAEAKDGNAQLEAAKNAAAAAVESLREKAADPIASEVDAQQQQLVGGESAVDDTTPRRGTARR
mgnify:CR=1 FL=1